MGAFFTNFNVRSGSASAVRDAMASLAQSRAYVSPPRNGWVTVYDEASDEQNDEIIRKVASGLSKKLETHVLAFLVHDSDIAVYWLYERGSLRDEFNSSPDYFGESVSDATRARLAGKTEALLALCKSGTTRSELDQALHPPDGPPVMAEDMISDLASLLGIDEARATVGFTYFEGEGADLLPDVEEFEPIGGAERKRKTDVPAATERASSAATPAQMPAAPLDFYPLGVSMMVQRWSPKHEESFRAYSAFTGAGSAQMMKQLQTNFDKQAKRWLKQAGESARPTFDELKTARDEGPDALAELLARRTPELLVEYAFSAIPIDAHVFIAALLKNGLDPNARNHHGRTSLDVAEQYGKGTRTYELLKAASDQKG